MVRSGLRHFALLVLLLGAWSAAAVVRPSAATAAPEAPKTEDPRLNQRVTLDLMRVPLSDLCEVSEIDPAPRRKTHCDPSKLLTTIYVKCM